MRYSAVSGKIRPAVIILLIFILIFGLNWFGGRGLRNIFLKTFSSIEGFFATKAYFLREWLESFGVQNNTLKEENNKLKQENLFLYKRLRELEDIALENQALREALKVKERKSFVFEMVRMVVEDLDADFLIVQGGRNSGLEKGMAVITPKGVLVGRVENVDDDFSRISLITSPSLKFDIEIHKKDSFLKGDSLRKKKFLGIAKGRGRGEMEFDLVSKEATLEKGDIVVSSQLGAVFPQGFLVGEVEEIEKSDTASFQRGKIKPYFRESDISILFVIKNFASY